MKKEFWNNFLGLIVCILLSLSAGFVGSQYMPGEWYEALNKPPWNPPNWVFGPVWTALYIMMGISLWIVWKSNGISRIKIPLVVFIIQLILNASWSYIFFGLQNTEMAFYELLVLCVFIVLTIVLFIRLNLVSGILLIPYLMWVSFAGYLNYTIWQLNI